MNSPCVDVSILAGYFLPAVVEGEEIRAVVIHDCLRRPVPFRQDIGKKVIVAIMGCGNRQPLQRSSQAILFRRVNSPITNKPDASKGNAAGSGTAVNTSGFRKPPLI